MKTKPEKEAEEAVKRYGLLRKRETPMYCHDKDNRKGDYWFYPWGKSLENLRLDFVSSDSGVVDRFNIFLAK